VITIIDYGAGNLRSVQRACRALNQSERVVRDPDEIRGAERVIFPGVGAAPSAMERVIELGFDDALREAISGGIPTLGICIGAQIALDRSEEGDTPCLGLLPGVTRRFDLADQTLKVPHIGWNEVRPIQPHPLLEGLRSGDAFYFVHGYFLDPSNSDDAYAMTDYGGDFCSAIGRDNFFATQFHPEKSGRLGLALLERFGAWDGKSC
jgi:glutamine amidotransferase